MSQPSSNSDSANEFLPVAQLLSAAQLLTAAECRELDRRAIEEFAVPGLLLMEHASIGLAVAITDVCPPTNDSAPIRIVCGPGNNGGDGYAAARHLTNARRSVDVHELIDPTTMAAESDAAVQREMLIRQGVTIVTHLDEFDQPVDDPCLWVDAIFGTGLTRPPSGRFAEAIEAMNSSPAPTLAVDIPSGLDADRGEPLEFAVQADWTITFGALKVGFTKPTAKRFLGALSLVPIGLPRALLETTAPGFPPIPVPIPIDKI